jgi:hypothetical protein
MRSFGSDDSDELDDLLDLDNMSDFNNSKSKLMPMKRKTRLTWKEESTLYMKKPLHWSLSATALLYCYCVSSCLEHDNVVNQLTSTTANQLSGSRIRDFSVFPSLSYPRVYSNMTLASLAHAYNVILFRDSRKQLTICEALDLMIIQGSLLTTTTSYCYFSVISTDDFTDSVLLGIENLSNSKQRIIPVDQTTLEMTRETTQLYFRSNAGQIFFNVSVISKIQAYDDAIKTYFKFTDSSYSPQLISNHAGKNRHIHSNIQ